MSDPGRLAAGITIVALVCFGFIAAFLTRLRRKAPVHQEARADEEGQMTQIQQPPKAKRKHSKPPQLPIFKTKSSLSMPSSPTAALPKTPKTPGIRFTLTTPSKFEFNKNVRPRNSGSIDSLPSMETVLERYEKEADAHAEAERTLRARPSDDDDLGEPGPAFIEASVPVKQSLLKQTLDKRA